jgi:hypothetical protein
MYYSEYNLGTVGLLYILMILLGVCIFMALYITDKNHFTGAIDENAVLTSGMYFTVSTISTIGYGDITPTTPLCRAIIVAYIVLIMIINVIIARHNIILFKKKKHIKK